MNLLGCHHCEEVGHWVQECPLLTVPASKAEHEARFQRVMERFFAGEITPHAKRRVIETENRLEAQRQKEMAKK